LATIATLRPPRWARPEHRLPVARLHLEELTTVDEPLNHLVDRVGPPGVGRDQLQEVLDPPGADVGSVPARRERPCVMREVAQVAPSQGDGCVVIGLHVVHNACGVGGHL